MNIEPEAFTIDGFCLSHGISRRTFYNLDEDGKAPRTMRVRRRVLISREAAADWRREREQETAAARAADVDAAA